MRAAHQQVLSASEQAETEAENFYLELKKRKKEEKELQRAEIMEAAKLEREVKRKADQEAKMPILKNFVTSELKEINKMLLVHSQSIARAGGKQGAWLFSDICSWLKKMYTFCKRLLDNFFYTKIIVIK